MFKWLNKLSKKHWLIILMIASVFLSAFGKAAAEPMRGLAHWLLALGQPGMGLTASIKSRLHGGADGGLSSFEASDLKKKLEEATWRCEKAEADLLKRMDEEKTRVKVCGQMSDFPCELMSAHVAAGEPLPYGQTRLVDKGRVHGAGPESRVVTVLTDRSKSLPPRLATINSSALVGRLLETGAYFARVQLITDSGFHLRCRIIRDPAVARTITETKGGVAAQKPLTHSNNVPVDVVADGDGVDGLTVCDVKKQYGIMKGDWLVTSRDDAFMPEHVRIGRVVEVKDDPKNQLFVIIHVQPSADLSSLKDVLIVYPIVSESSGARAKN